MNRYTPSKEILLFLINSNKSCFWIGIGGLNAACIDAINSNKSCFWIISYYNMPLALCTRLTVTKVVFELPNNDYDPDKWDKINSNKSCFWICVHEATLHQKNWINSNKSCFWIHITSNCLKIYKRLTVTKVVFEYFFNLHFIHSSLRLTVTKVVFEFLQKWSYRYLGHPD